MAVTLPVIAASAVLLAGQAVAWAQDLAATVQAGNVATVGAELAAGADANAAGELGLPLHIATRHDDPQIASLLLERGADIEAADLPLERRPLHVAASYGSARVAALLIRRGAALSVLDLTEQTPLMLAATYDHIDVARLLLDAGAGPDEAPNKCGGTALAIAVQRGSQAIAELLLDHGAIPDAVGVSGPIPIFLAACRRDTGLLELLIHRGADVGATDETGRSAVQEALACGRPAAAALLLRPRGATAAGGQERARQCWHGREPMGCR